MPRLEPVSTIHHASRRWRRPSGYSFAAADILAPLVLQEMPKAVMSLPITLIRTGGDEVPAYRPAALLGLTPGRNLLLGPAGRWLGDYIPAAYRSYPFALATDANGQRLLCVDADSGLLSDQQEDEHFFTAEGKPSPVTEEILAFLTQLDASQAATVRACAMLALQGLLGG